MKLYYRIPDRQCEEAEECGFSIAEEAVPVRFADGKERPCIFASLSPGEVRYDPKRERIVTLEVEPERICIAEGVFREEAGLAAQARDGVKRQRFESLYAASFVPAREYTFGRYFHPECPISFSFLPGAVRPYREERGFPVICENAEALYTERAFQTLCEQYDGLSADALRYCGERLCEAGEFEKLEGRGYLIFLGRTENAPEKLIISY